MDSREDRQELPCATLVISGDDVHPATVSEIMRRSPTRSFARGDPYGRGRVRKHGMWALSSEHSVASDDLDDHLAWLLDRIEPVLGMLQDYRRANDCSAFITCLWPSPHGHGGPCFSPRLLMRIGAANLPLSVDTYLLGDG